MAVASPESVNLEAQSAELQAVLHSKHFARAPKLAHLLSYLCEKLFAGEANGIKEYTVGVDVFHRGPSFDQDSDSIVRVEANRLRKRLAEYYASEGAAHEFHITIPVGQYVPEFECAAPRQSQPKPDAPTVEDLTEIERVATRKAGQWFGPRDRRAWWLIAGVALLFVGLSYAQYSVRQQKQQLPVVAAKQSYALPTAAESLVGLPMGDGARILAGASRSLVDHAGNLWNADAWFEGGTGVKSSAQHISRTQDPGFYRTSRQGQFRYKIPLKKGVYELRLHFAETIYGAESNGTGGEGSRIMTVRANGKTLLSRFDVVADAGGSGTADVKVFTDVEPATDGFLYLEFSGEDGKQAILSAIEILPGVRGHIRPVRLLARQTPYYSNDSQWWSPDNYFQGGQLAVYTSPVSGTDDPELYETERWGNFSYAIPVAPGKYSVSLYFATRHGDGNQSSASTSDGRAAAAHTFNVFCNGRVLLEDFNLLKEARQTDVVVRKVSALEPNAQGKLVLSFVPIDGYATVTGIEVLPQ
jgi:malectin (di-glucose binding ER protein)